VHGTNDDTAAYEPDCWLGSVANFENWAAANRCGARAVEDLGDSHRIDRASDCEMGATVELVTLDGQGHITYRGHDGLELDTTRMAWDFLQRHTN